MAGKRLLALFLVLTPIACVQSEFSSSAGKVKKEPVKEQAAEANPIDDGNKAVILPVEDDIEPKADQAVTKGSFTAWAVPPNPRPRESYWINIEVKLPTNTQNYLQTDLAGTVVGTDL